MSFTNPKPYRYDVEYIAFNVGEAKDTYAIGYSFEINKETNEATYTAKLLRNPNHNIKPSDPTKIVPNQKYREEIVKGTENDCLVTLKTIIKLTGHYTNIVINKEVTETFTYDI